MEHSTRLSWKIALVSVAMAFFMAGGNLFAQLVGGTTYPVNGTSNPPTTFASLYEAGAYLQANGVTGTGQVILELQSGYSGVNDSVTFRDITGLSADLGLTIRPAAGFSAVTAVTPGSGQPSWAIRLSGVSYVTLDGRQGGVGTTPSWTIQALGTSGQQAIRLDHQRGSMTNNTVKYCILEGEAATTTAGILAITTASNIAANTFTNHEIAYNIIRSGATYRGYAITAAVMSNSGNTGNKIHHNEIYDFYMYGINFTGGFPGMEIYNNKFYHSKAITQPTASQFAGIYFNSSASAGTKIYNNEIYDIQLTNATSNIHGIYMYGGNSSGSPVEIYNNFINIGSGLTVETIPVWGIRDYSNSGNLFNIYHNSVYIGGTVTSGSANSAAYRREVASGTNLKNNIFFNARSSGGTATGTHWAISTNNTASYLSINNNLYFANGTGGVLGTTDNASTGNKATLDAWKAVMTADNASVTGNPQFISASNLHINAAIATPVESGGVSGTGVTTDIDGDVRNVSTPDIGADEGTFMMLDEAGPTITYTALTNTTSTSNRTLSNVTITDVSGIAGDPNRPRMYFKKTTDASWVSVPANETSSPYTFTTDFSLVGGGSVSTGDTIQYFIIAQDVPGNVSANPGMGLVATDVNTITTYPTNPNIYRILPSISGTFTVGTSGDYATLTAAFADLNNKEITGPVVFSLLDADYSTAETFPLVINANSGSSDVNTVTIKPATGVTSTITGGTASSVIALNGCDYVIIDGSNAVSGTTKDLTIVNTYTGGTFNFGVGLYHNGTKGATNNTIKNCVIKGTPTVTNSYGILLNYAGGNYHNTSIINNTVKNAKVGIQFVGVSGAVTNDGIISGNTIGDATEPIKSGGIVVTYANNTLITGNEIFGEAAGNSNYSQYGISLSTASTNTKIRKNVIHDFYYNGTGGWGNRGIYYNSDATTVTEISNNWIYNIKADGWTSATFMPTGIMINAGGNVQMYYNSINLTGNVLSNSSASYGIGIYAHSGATLLDIRNNVIKNSLQRVDGGAGSNKNYAVYSAAANTAYTDINNNDYFVDGINPNVGYLGSDRADLAAWQTATGKDTNSVSGDPGFISDTDLHIDVYGASPVSNAGTPIAGITDDIDGDVRSLTTPDIGADEYTGVSPLAFDLLSPVHTATDVPINGMLLWETSTYATSYDVYLDAVNPPVTLLDNVTDTTVAYSVAPLTTYYWKVIAKNGNGTYESGVFSFTTGTNPPAAPSDLTFEEIHVDSVFMSWTDNATDEDGFRVYRSTELNGIYTNVSGDLDSLVGTGLTGEFGESGLEANTKYYYKVVSYSAMNGESDAAVDSIATLANIPGTPILSDAGVVTMKVTIDPNGNPDWTEYSIRVTTPVEAIDDYVQADGSIGSTRVWQSYTAWGGANGITVKGLTPATAYTFDMTARNLDGEVTEYSATAELTTTTTDYPITEGFEGTTFPPTGWAVQDLNAGNTWIRSTGSPHTGSASAAYPYHGSLPANDWLFSPALVMDSGAIYKITYWYKAHSASYAENMKVAIGLDQIADSMTTMLADHPGIVSTTYLTNTIEYVAPASGVYFVGFHCYSIADQWNLYLDDITISPVYAVDYGITGISMVDGIPPVMLKTAGNDIVNKVDGEMLNKQKGVERSDVNNSRILSTGKAYQGKLKAVANDKNLTELNTLATENTRDITMRFTVANFGIDTTKTFELAWDVAGTPQTGYTSTTGITNDGSVEVDLGGNYSELGTHTTNATLTVADDENLTNNDLSFYRTLVYPDTMFRIQYDNGTNVQSTFIGANGPPFLAGVRFTASADMHLTQIDGLYRNEASTDSITVQIWAAGATNAAPGALLYTKNFGGENYISAGGDYITIPLGDEAPVFASGTDFWVSIGFANVPYPMGAHNSGFTPGRSFYSMDAGATWNPLVITTERAWLMRVVGVPYEFSAPTAVNLLEPADETFITVDENSTDDATILWTSSTDADGDPVTYSFWASLNSDFSDSLVVSTGSDTTLTLAYSAIDAVLAAWGIADGDTADIYWKVIATDGMFETPSAETFMLTVYRFKFEPTVGWVMQTSGTVEDLYSVKAVSQTVAWAAGAAGTVLRTVNGGTTWEDASGGLSAANDLYHVFATSADEAYVIADPAAGGYIYKTTDGGANWYQVFFQSGGFLNGVYVDGMNGYGVGDPVGATWTVIQTTDGGESWFRMATEPTAVSGHYGYNNSLQVIGDNIWFGTNGSRIYYSTDAGATWSFTATSFVSSYDLQFNDATNGIIAGTGIQRTLDGGATLTAVTVPGSGNFGALGGAGLVDYWAGRGTTIYHTRTTGDVWTSEFTAPAAIYAMDFTTYDDNGTTYTSGWTTTSGGSIVAFFDTTCTVGIDDPVNGTPTSFALYQNYPNPFNPTTTIKYDLKENAKVTLKIYNALGQEVRTLVNTKQNAGSYQLNWDGRNNSGMQVSSGVYIYRIQAGNFVKSHKMMLLK